MSADPQKTPQALRESALALTQSMRAAAQADDWVRVIEDEYQRRPLLADYLGCATPEQIAPFIDSVLQSDKIVMELGGKVRDEAAGELRSINKGQRARVAYAENGE